MTTREFQRAGLHLVVIPQTELLSLIGIMELKEPRGVLGLQTEVKKFIGGNSCCINLSP
jgi:hypothetical protein